ncbi:RHS repeat-associated core domain-containing protein [Actinoplanes sp. NPDC026619]|uniref:RHS repeat-associated core domain-containing protein n=1 Tax=Actinoplanes sp. NPDC026619 TaxID=3155798 RepID=UPI0033CCEE69
MSRWRRAGIVAVALFATPALIGVSGPAGAAPKDVSIPSPVTPKRVELADARAPKRAPAPAAYTRFDPGKQAALPKAQATTVSLRAAGSAGTSPISIARAKGTTPDQVRLTTVDQKVAQAAGVRGVMFTLGAASGSVAVSVDPSSFRNAYGGGYASRLHLVRLPACAVTTPEAAACRTQTPVSSSLTATVALASADTVLAATSGAGGDSGDYSATSLSPGGTWGVSGNTGAFTYSYPITVPPPIGGTAPSLALSYNSAAQDARTAGTNNQSSWVGDGWSLSENFVERSYQNCTDVTDSGAPKNSGDQCWAGEVLTLSLNGKSTALVYDDKAKTFRPADDDATTKVDRLTNATNGTKNNEYFRVVENGTQYYFGLNRLPGWTANAEVTNSAWTMPVYQAGGGVSACPSSSTFADTACTLGYRFNLDYVVDPRGNAMAYYYTPEAGYYGPNMKDKAVSYVRGGYLERIDYGITPSTVYSATAPEQIVFNTAERCIGECTLSESHPEYYPDVPTDLNCAASGDCTNHGPSFWSRRKLTSIVTEVKDVPVDRYDLTQTFPDNGDHAPTLWLESIKRTGVNRLGGGAADTSAGTVSFNMEQLPNRVGTVAGLPRMYFNRIKNIVTETGAETVVTYDTPDCASLPSDPATNTTGCFPVYWTPEYQPEPLLDWFYTHPVTSVATTDGHNTYQDGSQPSLLTQYKYVGKPGWHFDDNEVVKKKYRTYGQFRGYPEVDVTTGNPSVFHYTDGAETHDRKTLTKTYYFVGMGGTLTSTDASITTTDKDEYAGQVFETVNYTGDGGSVDTTAVTVPTTIGPTASRARDGLSTLQAKMVRTARTVNRQKVSYGWRKTETLTFANSTLGQSTTGMTVQVDDRGETGAAGNVAKCTFTQYLDGSVTLPDGSKAPLVLPARVVSTDQDCTAAGASRSGNLTSEVRNSYDGNAFAYNGDGQSSPAGPTKGNITLVQQASAATGATASTFMDVTATTYDSYGRPTSTTRTPNSKAADGSSLAQASYTKYTPASAALPTTISTVTQVTAGSSCAAVTTSSVDCQVASVTLDPARQVPITKTDVAGALTSMTYDGLGRLTAVWLPNKSKAASAPANYTYSYQLSTTAPSVVTSRTLTDDPDTPYLESKTQHDAMLRTLEVQTTGENGSTVVSDTQYDSHGWTVLTNDSYATAGAPRDTLISDRLSQVSVPATTVTDHDGLGRTTQVTAEHNGVKTSYTRTAYTGDKVTAVPPTGAVATTETTDARGRITKLEQYTTKPGLTGTAGGGFTATGGSSQSIAYEYTQEGKPAKVTGPDNSVWSYTYDLLGRETSLADPDAGTGLTAYDDAGNTVLTRDARGIQLAYTYDLLGRKLTGVDKSKSNFKFASWTFDTLKIGKLTSSSRYVSGVTGSYTTTITGYSTLGKPLGQNITLPSTEKPLPASYTTEVAYSPNTELVARQTDPAVGGLPGEVLTYGHNLLGAATSTSGIDLYVSGSTYTDFGQPSRLTMGASSNEVQALYSYDEYTLRQSGRAVYRSQGIGPLVDKTSYTYDDAGNPLSAINEQSESGNIVTDAQCFRYDDLARLVDARTSAGTCADQNVASGAGSYWQTYSYNAIGDRTQVVDHSTNGGADLTTGYTNGCSSGCNRTGVQPHTLTATTGGADPTKFVYDVAGNLLTRTPTKAAAQTLTWDDEGNLASVTAAGATTRYLYDADGNQLIRREAGRTTLFAGDTEIVVDTGTAQVGAVRTYSHGGSGGAVAVRSTLPGGGAHYLFSDRNNSATLAVDTTSQEVSRQQMKPYGEDRANANTTAWPDLTRGYLGAPKDVSTGYTDMGARKYDPALGRFLSPDPMLQFSDPSQLGGYAYAADNPITSSDPSGLCPQDRCDGYGKSPAPAPVPTAVTTDTNPTTNSGKTICRGSRCVKQKHRCGSEMTCSIIYTKYFDVLAGFADQWDDLGEPFGPTYGWEVVYSDPTILGRAWVAVYQDLQKHDPDMLRYMQSPSELVWQMVEAHASQGLGLGPKNTPFLPGLKNPFGKSLYGCRSFSADTLVLLADRSTKRLDQLRPGDVVLASTPETGTTEGREVEVVWVHDDDLYVLTVDGGRLVTTEDHLFWSVTDQRWEETSELVPGELIRTPDGTARVDGFDATAHRRAPAYTLTVADLHTFYVLAGNTPVLVHNGCEIIAGPKLGVLRVTAANPSESEVRGAQHMAARGGNVELRDPVGTRKGGATSDLLVDGARWDVYTPKTRKINQIMSGIAGKHTQVHGGGVVVDLTGTGLSAGDFPNALNRANGMIRSWDASNTPISGVEFIGGK